MLDAEKASIAGASQPADQGEPSSDTPGEAQQRPLDDPWLYFNRELSWLDFNDRVLQLAEDPDVRLLERAKFCAIYEDNLDEFFMVRVAGLHDQVAATVDPRGADDMSAEAQLQAVRDVVVKQRRRLERCFERSLRPALSEQGIRLVGAEELDADQLREVSEAFRKRIFPALTPLLIGLGRPFPYISNLSLSLIAVLRDPDQDTEVIARVKVPTELLGRFVELSDGESLVPLEDVIAANLGDLFPGMEVVEHSLFRVTRDTDYDVSDEADDLRQAVEDELRRRRFGEVVRLEVKPGMNPKLRELLVHALKVSEDQVYESGGMLGLDDLWGLVGRPGHPELLDPPFAGVTHPRLLEEDGKVIDVMAAMRDGDLLVHHPYDSFATSVEPFIQRAVQDPDVLAIKQTVYRTSADSPLVPGLIEASERGKQAVCMVELKARFDESANIRWAKKLEQAGVHVVYGIPSLKTHAKCALVARQEGGTVRHYAHIGTGNYNPKTARIYTDFGLFTADPDLCSDIAEMFNYLTGYSRPRRFRKALIAPHNLADGIIDQIDRTIEAHTPENPSRIRMKMNSLLDAPSIQALYRASQAGVKVELNVRGICALRPGIAGISENIEVVSVVGRFLEHSRVYAFERGGETTMYMGSADLMPRNLYNRVELVVPIEDERIRGELNEVLDLCLADNASCWELGSDGSWTRRQRGPDEERRSAQETLIQRHTDRTTEAAQI